MRLPIVAASLAVLSNNLSTLKLIAEGHQDFQTTHRKPTRLSASRRAPPAPAKVSSNPHQELRLYNRIDATVENLLRKCQHRAKMAPFESCFRVEVKLEP